MSEDTEMLPSVNLEGRLFQKSEFEFRRILESEFLLELCSDSPRSFEDLYRDYKKGELWLEFDNCLGEVVRHTDVANVDVFLYFPQWRKISSL